MADLVDVVLMTTSSAAGDDGARRILNDPLNRAGELLGPAGETKAMSKTRHRVAISSSCLPLLRRLGIAPTSNRDLDPLGSRC